MRMKLQATSLHSGSYGVSKSATAAIVSTVLEDVDLISEKVSSRDIDIFQKSKGEMLQQNRTTQPM